MQKKSLSKRIAERAQKKPSVSAQNKAAFLSQKKEIAAAMKDGWSMRQIHETLYEEGTITFSYQSFRSYVNKLIKAREKENSEPVKTPGKKDSFSVNSEPNKDDLI